jgi:hypothetical protein
MAGERAAVGDASDDLEHHSFAVVMLTHAGLGLGDRSQQRPGLLPDCSTPGAWPATAPPFQLCTVQQRGGPGRCCSPSTSKANGSLFADLETAPSMTG